MNKEQTELSQEVENRYIKKTEKLIPDDYNKAMARSYALDYLGLEKYPQFAEIVDHYKHGVRGAEKIIMEKFRQVIPDFGIDEETGERILRYIYGTLE